MIDQLGSSYLPVECGPVEPRFFRKISEDSDFVHTRVCRDLANGSAMESFCSKSMCGGIQDFRSGFGHGRAYVENGLAWNHSAGCCWRRSSRVQNWIVLPANPIGSTSQESISTAAACMSKDMRRRKR